MLRPIEFFEHGSDVVVTAARREPQRARLDLKPTSWLRLARLSQPQAEQTIDNHLEGLAAATHFLFQEGGNIIVDSESRSHIMMLSLKAS